MDSSVHRGDPGGEETEGMGRDSPAVWGQCPRGSGWEGRPRSVRGTSHHLIHQPPVPTAAGKEGKLCADMAPGQDGGPKHYHY